MAGPWEKYQQASAPADGPWAKYGKKKPETAPVPETPIDPTEGMSGLDRFRAGAGKSLVDTARGIRQAATEAIAVPFSSVASIYGVGGDNAASTGLSAPARKAAELRAEESERKKQDAPLMATRGGMGGYVAGSVAQLLGPAALARGTAAAPAILPRTTIGNALQGAAFGAVQPVGTEDSRMVNTTIGAGAGAVGAAVPQLLGAGYRAGRSILEPITRAGQERIVGRAIQRSATDPTRLAQAAPSAIPGVTRTLAEETADPGIGLLQRQFSTQLADQAAGNNAARAGAIRGAFEGADSASARSIEDARDTAASSALRTALSRDGADASRLVSQVGRIERAYTGRPAVQQAMQDVRGLLLRDVPEAERKKNALAALQEFADSGRKSGADFDAAKAAMTAVRRGEVPSGSFASQRGKDALAAARKVMSTETKPHDSVATLYNVRKTIGDMLGGKFGNDKAYAQAATRELMAVRKGLDRVISKVSPEFGDYLRDYSTASRRADQARIGEKLLDRSRQAVDPRTGERMMTANDLAASVNNIEGVVRQATGFRKASADKALTAEQRGLVGMLGDDASRMAAAQNAGRAVGSDTAQNLATRNILSTLAGGSKLANLALQSQPVQRVAALGEKTYGLLGVPERLQSVMVEALSDPTRARQILGRLPTADRSIVEEALSNVSRRLAVGSVPALTE